MEIKDTSVQKLVDEAAKTIDNVYDILVVKTPNNKLPERIFASTFAPYFVGDKNLSEDQTIVTTWISIAGHPANKVDIIDDAGNTVVTVPPLFDTSNIDATGGKQSKFADMAYNYEMRSATIPQAGDAYLNNALNKSASEIVKAPSTTEEYRKMWDAIYNRYHKGEKSDIKEIKKEEFDDGELIFD